MFNRRFHQFFTKFGKRNFHTSFKMNNQVNGNYSSSNRNSSLRKVLLQSVIVAGLASSITFILALRSYNREPYDSFIDKLFKKLSGPYRNYYYLISSQPEIENGIYKNELLSFDFSNAKTDNEEDPLSIISIQPGVLLRENLQEIGGRLELYDDFGNSLSLDYVQMTREEYIKSQPPLNDKKENEKTDEELLQTNDLEYLEKAIKKGLEEGERIEWIERINTKHLLSSKYMKLPESLKSKPNCIVAIIRTLNAYPQSPEYFNQRYGKELGSKIKRQPNGDLYRGIIATPYHNYFIAIGRSYPNQMINFDIASKDLKPEELNQILKLIPTSQQDIVKRLMKQSNSKPSEITKILRDTLLRLYIERLSLSNPSLVNENHDNSKQ
ncbi:hypothetical protein ABK040_007818 [Willaertia magna]